jgi:hypothetical protein
VPLGAVFLFVDAAKAGLRNSAAVASEPRKLLEAGFAAAKPYLFRRKDQTSLCLLA